MIGLTCSCPNTGTLLVTLVRRPDEIKEISGNDDAFCIFSVECTGCKAQMYFSFFDAPAEGERNRVEVTYKSGGECTKDPNTCTKLFCGWSKCAH